MSPSDLAASAACTSGSFATATAFVGSASTFVGSAATAFVGSAATASREAGGVEPDEEYGPLHAHVHVHAQQSVRTATILEDTFRGDQNAAIRASCRRLTSQVGACTPLLVRGSGGLPLSIGASTVPCPNQFVTFASLRAKLFLLLILPPPWPSAPAPAPVALSQVLALSPVA